MIYILMDCSSEPADQIGVPVGVFTTMSEALLASDMCSEDFGYDVSETHWIVAIEQNRLYAVDGMTWYSIPHAWLRLDEGYEQ